MTPRRYFSDKMFSPYFQSDHYKNESHEIKLQKKFEDFFKKILLIDKFKKLFKN